MVKRVRARLASATGPTDSQPPSVLGIHEAQGATTLTLRVTPRAARDSLTIQDGQLRVRLRAAPVDGAANSALIALLADRLQLPRRSISIIHGDTARVKRLAFAGVTPDDVRERIARAVV